MPQGKAARFLKLMLLISLSAAFFAAKPGSHLFTHALLLLGMTVGLKLQPAILPSQQIPCSIAVIYYITAPGWHVQLAFVMC